MCKRRRLKPKNVKKPRKIKVKNKVKIFLESTMHYNPKNRKKHLEWYTCPQKHRKLSQNSKNENFIKAKISSTYTHNLIIGIPIVTGIKARTQNMCNRKENNNINKMNTKKI